MRRATITTTLAALGLAVSLTACGPGDAEVTTDADKPAATKSDDKPKDKPAPAKSKAQKPAGIGDTITLKGFEGENIAVTVLKVADNAKSGDGFSVPEDGNRWYGIQFQLVNVGTKPYHDSPGNGLQVQDAQGQQFNGVFADITAGPSLASDVRLAPGAKALGWWTFEVPKGAKVAQVQMALNSGMADQSGQWKLQ
ncbi:DUF4352 domain-containing protein [Streptomyces sp. DT18]